MRSRLGFLALFVCPFTFYDIFLSHLFSIPVIYFFPPFVLYTPSFVWQALAWRGSIDRLCVGFSFFFFLILYV